MWLIWTYSAEYGVPLSLTCWPQMFTALLRSTNLAPSPWLERTMSPVLYQHTCRKLSVASLSSVSYLASIPFNFRFLIGLHLILCLESTVLQATSGTPRKFPLSNSPRESHCAMLCARVDGSGVVCYGRSGLYTRAAPLGYSFNGFTI